MLCLRCLRLYLSTEKPSSALVRVVNFIVTVYAPGWFRYRVHADITDGARNFHFLLQCSMRLDAVDREIALDVLKKNGFWAHGENILVAMLADKRQHIRAAWAVDVILRCRQRPPAADDIRQFQPPDILCSAEDYPDMVHPVDLGKTEPPMTMSLTDSQLVAGYDQPLSSVRFRATRRQ